MAGKENDKSFYMKLLIVACAFMMLLSFSIFNHMKGIDTKYKRDKSASIKEKMDLKDELDSLKSELKMKSETIDTLETDNKSITDELAQVKKAIVEIETKTSIDKESLLKSYAQQNKTDSAFDGLTTDQIIKKLSSRETNESVKKFLDDVVVKLGMIIEGKVVTLEPIVVTDTENQQAGQQVDTSPDGQGEILSVDKDTGLIVVNIGRDQGIREEQKLTIFNNREVIGIASVIKLRYKISAAIMETYQKKHSIKDVREGLSVATN